MKKKNIFNFSSAREFHTRQISSTSLPCCIKNYFPYYSGMWNNCRIIIQFQSVVIISKLPFVNLFGELCALLAPEFFDSGSAVMEVAIREIDQWPPPVPGQTIHLPLIGVLFQVCKLWFRKIVPNWKFSLENVATIVFTKIWIDYLDIHSKQKLQIQRTVGQRSGSRSEQENVASADSHIRLRGWHVQEFGERREPRSSSVGTRFTQRTDRSYGQLADHLRRNGSGTSGVSITFWRVLVHLIIQFIGRWSDKCIRIFFPDSTIAPLKYCADYRPYFTIHDSEFKEYTTDAQTPPAVILGVTNPFFAKTLQRWPHIIRISEGAGKCQLDKLK